MSSLTFARASSCQASAGVFCGEWSMNTVKRFKYKPAYSAALIAFYNELSFISSLLKLNQQVCCKYNSIISSSTMAYISFFASEKISSYLEKFCAVS